MITGSRNKKPMSRAVQQEFIWPEATSGQSPDPEPAPKTAATVEPDSMPNPAPLAELQAPPASNPPMAKPLREVVEAGVFGTTTDGPIDPDEVEVRAMTEEHGHELVAILADIQAVEDAVKTGEDPRTGKTPRTTEAETKLREFLDAEKPRLKSAYATALDAYARGFGEEAAAAIDNWARKTVADCTIAPSDRYDPGHPWHYLPEGDNAAPIPIEQIEADIDVGRHIERELPKNPKKRAEKLQSLLAQEREHVQQDKLRYQEIIERGAEALSRYDREIAHTSDAMAIATALSLKFNHIRYGLGRLAWLEQKVVPGT